MATEIIGYATKGEVDQLKADINLLKADQARHEALILQVAGVLETMEHVLGASINKFIAMGTLSHEEVHRQETRMGHVANSIQNLKHAKLDR